jgi:hypothetical protein
MVRGELGLEVSRATPMRSFHGVNNFPWGRPMPIRTQPDPHPKRRRPWLWALLSVPGVLVLLVAGLGVWGCLGYRHYTFGRHAVWFGRHRGNLPTGLYPPLKVPGFGFLLLIPDTLGGGNYEVSWSPSWPPKP